MRDGAGDLTLLCPQGMPMLPLWGPCSENLEDSRGGDDLPFQPQWEEGDYQLQGDLRAHQLEGR